MATQAQINAFENSQAYRDFQKSMEGAFGTMDTYDSPYFGTQTSGSKGRALDAAFESWLEQQGDNSVGKDTGMTNLTLPANFDTFSDQQQQAWLESQLPAGWENYGAADKIQWLNEKNVSPEELEALGTSEADIRWMQSQGYTAEASGGDIFAGTRLPTGWEDYSASEKLDFFNDPRNKITEERLLAAGVNPEDIDWAESQGFRGYTAPTAPKTTTIPASQSTLSPNFAPFVYKMLAKGEAAADLPYQPFTGQRFAETSPLYKESFQGLSNLQLPSEYRAGSQLAALAGLSAGQLGNYAPGQFANFYQTPVAYTPQTMSTGLGPVGSVQDYMSPYQQNVTDITSREMRRQADIGRQAEQARLSQAGAYGGSRQAIMEAERQRNLQQQMEDITTKGLQSAYDRAQQQRLQESQLGLEAQKGTEASRQFGAQQGMQSAQLGAQYGLEGAKQSEASRQFGAQLGLQSLSPMLSAASTLGNLGQQQFGSGLQGLQAQMGAGAVQQQLAQQPLDFGYQQFQESVKFPYQQASFMQSLLGGLPLQAAPYQANEGQSGMFSGLQGALAGLALYNAFNPK